MTFSSVKYLELWADSFHEGVWACDHFKADLEKMGYSASIAYRQGFIPEYTFRKHKESVVITVFGSYGSWSSVPAQIVETLEWGKPDFMLFDRGTNEILFAVEETAAVPTGNQALQRCERMYGTLRAKIPFWYLISEFGQHVDGGIRRDSIWPTIMALKLTRHFGIPCVVLHYSSEENPEDYGFGGGVVSLFSCLADMIDNYVSDRPILANITSHLTSQYREMLAFVKAQWSSIVDFIPNEEQLVKPSTSKAMADFAVGSEKGDIGRLRDFLIWPHRTGLPAEIARLQRSRGLIKYDALCELFERDLNAGKAYSLSSNTGSRPQPRQSVYRWIQKQRGMFDKGEVPGPKASYSIKLADFPESKNGLLHITTAKNIVYLYDNWSDVNDAVIKAFPRLKGRIKGFKDDNPVLVYISNSIKPGRIFGDPFTGQIAAFATVFGKIDPSPRYVIAYFPHQSYTQAVPDTGRRNKGLTLMAELTDGLLFAGGVLVKLSSREVI